jgi:amino acid transporter
MSRDGALPGSKYIYGVSKKLQLPIKSIILTFIVASILCLMPLINDTAFDAITGISTIGYQFSYAVPIFLRITFAKKTFV